MSQRPIIGIDLGTTYSCVGIFENDEVKILSNENGNKTTPSCVAFTATNRFIGDAAKTSPAEPANTIYDAKRLIGCYYDSETVQADIKHLPFKVVNQSGKAAVELEFDFLKKKKRFYIEEISSMVLQHLKTYVTSYLNGRTDALDTLMDAIITVPAYFNQAQRQATKYAGEIAQLNVLGVINEPNAGVVAYCFERKRTPQPSTVLVYDLGGGTFDVSILTISEQSDSTSSGTPYDVIKVKSLNGDTHLGGRDFDNILVDRMVDRIQKKHGINVKDNQRLLRKFRNECEQVKCALSTATETDLIMNMEGVEVNERITRGEFEEWCASEFQKTISIVEKTLENANLKTTDIDEVLVIGGSTRIPKVLSMLKDLFPNKVVLRIIKQDQAVAYGATVMAAQLSNRASRKIVVEDVIALPLGIELITEQFSPVIGMNSQIPCKVTKEYSATHENPTAVGIHVYEGLRNIAKENQKLAYFSLDNLAQPEDLSLPAIDVTFEVNTSGILLASVKDKIEGKSNSREIRWDHQHSQADIDKFKEEARFYQENDASQVAVNVARHDLEFYIYLVKKHAQKKIKLTGDQHSQLEEILDKEKKWLTDHQIDVTVADLKERLNRFKTNCAPFVGYLK